MLLDFSKIIVIDLEVICWLGKKLKGSYYDVIEFGVVVLEVVSGVILVNDGIFVWLILLSVSLFCIELIIIMLEMVEIVFNFVVVC